MNHDGFVTAGNGAPLELGQVPLLEADALGAGVVEAVRGGCRLVALFGMKTPADDLQLVAVLGEDGSGQLKLARGRITDGRCASVTPECPQAHLFEREIAEQFGTAFAGHAWLKPVRACDPAGGAAAATEFYRVEGEEVHEVAVGPVHAGIIEPGHFRFQCHGEHVFHLEIALGYQHRGVENALPGGPTPRTIHYMETLAGDTTAGHTTAYCQAVESLSGCRVPPRAQAIRGIALELERLANHTGDLGALANDVGYLPTSSYCGRIRGDFLNMTALLCGSRFGRGLIRPGGVVFDLNHARLAELRRRLQAARRDVQSAVKLLWDTPSVMARFGETGPVSAETCRQLGLVGVAARACGVRQDVRQDYPTGIYQFSHLPVSTWQTGDVFARAYVRWLEIGHSLQFIEEQLGALPVGSVRSKVPGLAPGRIVVSLAEGWRGEICHVAFTDEEGRFGRYKVVDPSFHNWMGLAMALREQQISDFPLCNKSFNLSYCGHDL